MSTAVMTGRIKEASPHPKTAGVFYLLTFATGLYALLVRSRLSFAGGLIAAACYVAVDWRLRVAKETTEM